MKPLRSVGMRRDGDRAAKAQRTESAFEKERDRIRAANEEKTKRLRTLRLAKEAADRLAAEKTAAEKAEEPPKKRGNNRQVSVGELETK